MLCWILLVVVIVLLVFVAAYFVRIDRELQAMRRDMGALTRQLKTWGFIPTEHKG